MDLSHIIGKNAQNTTTLGMRFAIAHSCIPALFANNMQQIGGAGSGKAFDQRFPKYRLYQILKAFCQC
jgi:hypothetical protein